jgi:hypothetical protein
MGGRVREGGEGKFDQGTIYTRVEISQ